MAETKIIKAVFGAVKSIITQPRYRYDYGQILEVSGITLPESFEARFSNAPTGESVRVLGQNQRVAVPDNLMRTGKSVWCYITVHDAVTDGRTMYTIRIPIKDATERTDAEPTPVQQDVIEQAIAALNAAVEQTAQDVEAADASAQSASDSADRAEAARDTAERYVDDVQNYAQQAQASASNASASATASANSASQAQQIKTDVEGMVDEAQSAAGASAQSALVSAQYASQASASATSASQSVETASTKASEASNSAQTASTKATEASGYASTASAKATESAQSASRALTYKTDAESAKTASQTAQGLAESARDTAVSAKTDAESARDDAETARDEAQSAVASISGALAEKAPVITDTASGAIASFSDGADDLPLKNLTVNIDPVQDLHGYDSPWTAGVGKNKLQTTAETITSAGVTWTVNDDGSITASGTATGYSTLYIAETPVTSSIGIVTISLYGISVQSNIATNVITLLDSSKNIIYTVTSGGYSESYTVDLSNYPDVAYIKVGIKRAQNNTVTSGTIYPQIELGSIPTSWSPYENICPISGWTGMNVSHSGADMSDPTLYPIAFPSEAGTVYGGKLDVLSGELVIDRANIASYNGETLPSTWISDRDVYASGTTPTTGAQVVYQLATPLEIQLTPQQVNSLLGVNNIWADSGDTEVIYRADTELWVQRKITEAVAAVLNS